MIGIRKRDIKFAEKVSNTVISLSDSEQPATQKTYVACTPEKLATKRFHSSGDIVECPIAITRSPNSSRTNAHDSDIDSPSQKSEQQSDIESSGSD